MGMQQKLEREYMRGFQDGQHKVNETLIQMARNDGLRQGSQITWDLVEEMIPKLRGIGPRTQEKILKAIRFYAQEEKRKIEAGG